jgi:hypothetical protein
VLWCYHSGIEGDPLIDVRFHNAHRVLPQVKPMYISFVIPCSVSTAVSFGVSFSLSLSLSWTAGKYCLVAAALWVVDHSVCHSRLVSSSALCWNVLLGILRLATGWTVRGQLSMCTLPGRSWVKQVRLEPAVEVETVLVKGLGVFGWLVLWIRRNLWRLVEACLLH